MNFKPVCKAGDPSDICPTYAGAEHHDAAESECANNIEGVSHKTFMKECSWGKTEQINVSELFHVENYTKYLVSVSFIG